MEQLILKNLQTSQALGEIDLFAKVGLGDSRDNYKDFRLVLMKLEGKGLIETFYDNTETLLLIRLKQVLH